MKLVSAIVVAVAMSGAAHAEKFDLLCEVTITQKLFDNPPTIDARTVRYSVDTDANLYRGHAASKAWQTMAVYPDRLVFLWGTNQTVVDRATGAIAGQSSGKGFSMKTAGICEKADYTPLPDTKF